MHAWIRFANLQLSPRTANALIDHFGTPDALFDATSSELSDFCTLTGKQSVRLTDPSFLPTASQLEFMETSAVRLVPRGDPEYPRNLKEIADPPPVLFVRGSLDEKDRFAVAIVGSRQATPYGRSVAAQLARDLSAAGLTVVSGGALGIDSAAHRATVEAGGRTLVVAGCGLDVDYPSENRSLFNQIAHDGRGALLSEFPLGATPEAWRFPLRNRVVSGLVMGVVVVEAGAQSGALITASNAAEQGRDVMAVPGNVDRAGSKGANALIKDGATLVEDARDVMQALGMLVMATPREQEQSRPPLPGLPEPQRRLMESLSLAPRHIDAIAAELKLDSAETGTQLTLMELAGLVRRMPGSCYIRSL